MKTNPIITFLLFLFLFTSMPAVTLVAQEAETEFTASDASGSKDKKSEKKKDKDVIDIDQVFFISLGINIVTVVLIIILIYYPNYRKMDYIFTYIIFNLVIFVLTFVLNEVKISMGAAFGLFAVFSMLRYRSAGISLKDMSYLFIFIALGLIGAIQLEYHELVIMNAVIFAGIYIMDGNLFFKKEFSKNVQYEVIELIKPERHEELMTDLRTRTGLNIHRISINKIDFLRDTATIRIYYYE